jgi:protocatechuate 3,4-dioxygenase beta subunit
VVVGPDGKPLAGALVEVFTKPEYLLSDKTYDRGKPEQRRIAACRTNIDGKFCFLALKSGKYELRSSSNGATGWNVSQIYVVVDAQKGLTKGLRVKMTLGI